MVMQIIPAIDILEHKVARLFQGDYNKASYYSHSPLEFAQKFALQGYSLLHVIDLSGAKKGSPQILEELKKILSLGLNIQVGGGIRTIEHAQTYLKAGVKHVIIGTQALIEPQYVDNLIATFPADAITVSLDVRNGKLGMHGWEKEHDRPLKDLLRQLELQGVKRIIITDITRDGTLSGVNTALYEPLIKAFPALEIFAAGGVASQADIGNLKRIGISGVIIGKAFYETSCIGINS